MFEDDVFAIYTKSQEKRTKIVEAIEAEGGLVGKNLTKKTTIVICNEHKEFQDEIKKLAPMGIDVVTPSWVFDSVFKKSRQSPGNYTGSASSSANAGAATDTKANKDADPAAKKQKTDSGSSSFFNTNSLWKGASTSKDGESFSFELSIKSRAGNKFEGTISWPSVDNALTKLRGEIDESQGKVAWEEYEAIQGADSVELPMFYTGKVTETSITGTLKDSAGEQSSFQLELTVATKEPDLKLLKTGHPYHGIFTEQFPFVFRVGSCKQDGTIEGSVKWPTVATLTKFSGKVNGDTLDFKETSFIKGDAVELPVSYSGKIGAAKIEGKYAGSTTGNFSMAV